MSMSACISLCLFIYTKHIYINVHIYTHINIQCRVFLHSSFNFTLSCRNLRKGPATKKQHVYIYIHAYLCQLVRLPLTVVGLYPESWTYLHHKLSVNSENNNFMRVDFWFEKALQMERNEFGFYALLDCKNDFKFGGKALLDCKWF